MCGVVDSKLASDARTLLGLGVGDRHVLEQILRAATNNELVSNHERDYVASLLKTHPAPDAAQQNSYVVEKPSAARPASRTMIIIAAVVVAVAATAAVIYYMSSDMMSGTEEPSDYMVMQDASIYGPGDFVAISGRVDAQVRSVEVSILDPGMSVVWSDDAVVSTDGSFSALVLAGTGDWPDGMYTLRATHDDEVYDSVFEYSSRTS